MLCTSQNQGPIPVFLLWFNLVSMTEGLDFHWWWIGLMSVVWHLATTELKIRCYFWKCETVSLSSRGIFHRGGRGLFLQLHLIHINHQVISLNVSWLLGQGENILFRITVGLFVCVCVVDLFVWLVCWFFFFFEGVGLGFLLIHALWSEERWEFIFRWSITFSSPIYLFEDCMLPEVYGLCRLATTLPLLRVAWGFSAHTCAPVTWFSDHRRVCCDIGSRVTYRNILQMINPF